MLRLPALRRALSAAAPASALRGRTTATAASNQIEVFVDGQPVLVDPGLLKTPATHSKWGRGVAPVSRESCRTKSHHFVSAVSPVPRVMPQHSQGAAAHRVHLVLLAGPARLTQLPALHALHPQSSMVQGHLSGRAWLTRLLLGGWNSAGHESSKSTPDGTDLLLKPGLMRDSPGIFLFTGKAEPAALFFLGLGSGRMGCWLRGVFFSGL